MDAKTAKKPRAPKAAKLVELLRSNLTESETKKLYKMLDNQHGHMAEYNRAKYAIELAESRIGTLPTDNVIGFEINNILEPKIVVQVPEPPKVKVARKPKAAGDAPAKRQPRKVTKLPSKPQGP